MQRNLNRFLGFDLDDPMLPDWIGENALTSGGYPYAKKLSRGAYEKQLKALQVELVKLLDWQSESGTRSILAFEGRDAAGKGGSIKVVREHLNPRQARIVALAKPSDRETSQWYFQRYAAELPAAAEMVLFDRSWYNRGVVEPVMGFCTPSQARALPAGGPRLRAHVHKRRHPALQVLAGDRARDAAEAFPPAAARPTEDLEDLTDRPRRHQPLGEFSEARDRMVAATHTRHAPWIVVKANDKRRAHLALIRHTLLSIDYPGRNKKAIGKVDKNILGLGPRALQGAD